MNESIATNNDRFYGAYWFLEQLANKTGITDDLLDAFDGNAEETKEILALAFYRLVENDGFGHIEKYQRAFKMPLADGFSKQMVQRAVSAVRAKNRERFLRLRLNRFEEAAGQSIQRFIVDIRWHNEYDYEGNSRGYGVYERESVEMADVTGYACPGFEPVYYRKLPANGNGFSVAETVIEELTGIGIGQDKILIRTDRCMTELETIAEYAWTGCPFIAVMDGSCLPADKALSMIKYDRAGHPVNLTYDKEAVKYSGSFDIGDIIIPLKKIADYPVSGLKINLYLDNQRRMNEIGRIQRRAEEEREFVKELATGIGRYYSRSDLIDILKYHDIFAPDEYDENLKDNDDLDPESKTEVVLFGGQKCIIVRNLDKEIQAYRDCGYLITCTHGMTLSAMEIYREYISRDAWDQPAPEKQMRNNLPDDCWPDRPEAGRDLIFLVANLLFEIISRTWDLKRIQMFECTSPVSVLGAMTPIRLIQTPRQDIMTRFTEEQYSICQAFDIEVPEACRP